MEAREYTDRDGRTSTSRGRVRRRRQTIVVKQDIALDPCASDAIVLAPAEFERVRQCLTNPLEKPSPAALEGAELLRSFPAPLPTP